MIKCNNVAGVWGNSTGLSQGYKELKELKFQGSNPNKEEN